MKKETGEKLLAMLLVLAVMVAVYILIQPGLRLVLLVPLYFALVELLTDLVRRLLGEPKRPKMTYEELLRDEEKWYYSRQNPEKMKKFRPVGWILLGMRIAVSLLNMLMVGDYAFWTGAGILCFLSALILCTVFPAYFSFNHLEGQKNRSTTFPIINLTFPYFLPLGVNSLRSLMTFTFISWMPVLEAVLLVTAVIGAVMRVAIPEFRRHTSNWVGGCILLLIFSFGLVAPVNHIFEPEKPQIVAAVVTEYHPGGYKVSPSYSLRLEDGTVIRMDAKDGFKDRNYRIWQTIPVEYHQGALGIDYYCYNH